jgi:hypothetical protein
LSGGMAELADVSRFSSFNSLSDGMAELADVSRFKSQQRQKIFCYFVCVACDFKSVGCSLLNNIR